MLTESQWNDYSRDGFLHLGKVLEPEQIAHRRLDLRHIPGAASQPQPAPLPHRVVDDAAMRAEASAPGVEQWPRGDAARLAEIPDLDRDGDRPARSPFGQLARDPRRVDALAIGLNLPAGTYTGVLNIQAQAI